MNATLPAYYSGLAAFQAVFASGIPILTYHKLGPRPARVRLKGLYVSGRLFARQLQELRAAGYTAASLNDWNAAGGKKLVITFDDGYVNVLRHGLEPLRQAGMTAIQFLPANLLGQSNEWDVLQGEARESIMDTAQVREWLSAGHQIGSHSLSHPHLTRLTPSQAREEIGASRKKLEDLFGRPVEHFCYPYGEWNEAVRNWVGEAGYKTACTTEPGVNQAGDSPLTLKRFTARYPSRSVKTAWAWLRSKLA